jgi:UDPglucose 6-dehydrogenase
MIGIIGYGMVGTALANGFPYCSHIISDPAINDITIEEVCAKNPEAIFVCVPTPSDDSNYSIIKEVLLRIKESNYSGLTVVKSTILPKHLDGFNVVYNPEFLSRKTAFQDFVNPLLVLFGGDPASTKQLYEIYKKYSVVNLGNIKFTDIKTASLAKYTFNTFYALKVTYMNQIYDVAQDLGVNFEELKTVLKLNPWMMGVSHLDVPGHEGRGFSGPCLPKDTIALANEFDVALLKKILEINDEYRGN